MENCDRGKEVEVNVKPLNDIIQLRRITHEWKVLLFMDKARIQFRSLWLKGTE